MTAIEIDRYVRRLPAEHQDIVAALRDLMGICAPGAREVISRGSLAWQGRKILAILSLSRTHVTFAFARGAEFTDDHGLLDGVGRTTRHVKIKKVDAIRPDALGDYIRQAVRLDQQ